MPEAVTVAARRTAIGTSFKGTLAGVSTVINIDRAEARNVPDPDTMDGIGEPLVAARTEPDVRAVVLTGAGDRAFCAGMGLRAFADGGVELDPDRPGPEGWSWRAFVARNAPLALAVTKRIMLQEAVGMTIQDIQAATKPVFESPDALEGARAFAERREPRWAPLRSGPQK
jgi:enoyl-CoA hydratase/carnithine racemase